MELVDKPFITLSIINLKLVAKYYMAEITTDRRFAYENMFRREMVSILTPVETKVMIYIIDRTLGWQKDRERISYREFLDGKANNYGVNIQKTSAYRSVKSLEEKGIVTLLSTSKRSGTLIKVNLGWTFEGYLDNFSKQCTHE